MIKIKSSKSTTIIYTTFDKMKEPGEYNFYGIIYDASFPQSQNQEQTQQSSKYECLIKLIDESVNSIKYPDLELLKDNLITLIIKSSSVPYIHSIGDIIRVHHGNYSHKLKRNIYLAEDTKQNSSIIPSWCIFSGLSSIDENDNIKPMLASKKNYIFDKQDEQIIKKLRLFIKEKLSLPKSICFFKENPLNKRIINKENDTTVQVIYKISLENENCYYVKDDTDICELHTSKYFDFIKVKDIIRIRNYRFSEKNILTTNQYSNILVIPDFLGYYKDFQLKIKGQKKIILFENKNNNNNLNNTYNNISNTLDTNDNTNIIYNNETDIMDETYNLINYDKTINLDEEKENDNENFFSLYDTDNLENYPKYEDSKKIRLYAFDFTNMTEKLFHTKKFSNILKTNDNQALIDVMLIKYHPQNLSNCVKYFCRNCKKAFSLENDFKININSKFYCSSCQIENYPYFYYNMVLECIENKKSNKIIMLHLNTFDGEGESIFGIMPTNFNLAKEQSIKLKRFLDELIESREYMRLLIKRVSIKKYNSPIYRIVGHYSDKD